MQSSHDFNTLFAYLWQDIGKYFRQDMLELAQRLKQHEGYLRALHEQSMALYDCVDLTPRERQAAHFLAVLTRYQEILYFHQNTNESISAEQWEGFKGLSKQLSQAADHYGAFLTPNEAQALAEFTKNYLAEKLSSPIKVKREFDDWRELARKLADDIYARSLAMNTRPSQMDIAEEIAKRFRSENIKTAHGVSPTAGYIKRNALMGPQWYQVRDARQLGAKEEAGEIGEKQLIQVPSKKQNQKNRN